MRVNALTSERIPDFIEYCKKYRDELDDSYLVDDELKRFELNEENPTYILVNDNDDIIGVASLIIDPYMKKGKKGRFRILHTAVQKKEACELMFKALLEHIEDINNVFLFIPEFNEKLIEMIETLKFSIERYAFLLERDSIDVPEYSFPEGFELKTFQFGRDEKDWCEVRNAGFARLLGHETPMAPEMISKMADWDEHLEGGMLILYDNEKPVGVVRASKELYKDTLCTSIGPLAIIPEYQGKGLGRNLLRAAVSFGKSKDMPKAVLSVNGENEKAIALYVKEGFKKVDAVICYNYNIR